MLKNIETFLRDEEGASAVEYALIAGLLAVVLVAAVGVLGNGISNGFSYIAGKLSGLSG